MNLTPTSPKKGALMNANLPTDVAHRKLVHPVHTKTSKGTHANKSCRKPDKSTGLLDRIAAILVQATHDPSTDSKEDATRKARVAVAIVFDELGRHVIAQYAVNSGQNPQRAAELWMAAPELAAPEVQIGGMLINAAKTVTCSDTGQTTA